MNQYLVDSNIIIDYTRKEEKATSFLESLEKIIVSSVTVAEVYQGSRDKQELKTAKQFFANTQILFINAKIDSLALELVENYTLSHGLIILDALIAATAIEHDVTLITANYRHYTMIKWLKVEKW